MASEDERSGPERLTVKIPMAVLMLGLGRTTVDELIGRGELETIKVGRARLVLTRSLHRFIDARLECE